MKQLLLILACAIVLFSCDLIGGERVDGNGSITTENRQLSDFKNVSSSGPMDVVLTQSSNFSVQIKGDENLLPNVTTSVDGNTIKLKVKQGYNLHPEKNLKVLISDPMFTEI